MITYVNPKNEGLLRVIEDLQSEHTRWQGVLEQGVNLRESIKDRKSAMFLEAQIRTAAVETKVDYLELLIRRYRSWLV